MSEELQFRTVLRGFDPDQVRSAVDDLQTSVVTARRIAADRTIELTRMQEHLGQVQRELEEATKRIGQLEQQEPPTAPATPQAPTTTDVGTRIGSILALANEEAEELRNAGREEARRRLDDADAAIAAARAELDEHAQHTRDEARQDADRILGEARHQASQLAAEAARDAEQRRAEAQAIVDRHRDQADAVAAFSAQVDQHTERLQLALSRVDQLAREEAGLVHRQAQEHTDRIQRDRDNQLAAVDARRESISAQLGTVGDLLRELGAGGGPASEPAGGEARSGRPLDAAADVVTVAERAFDHVPADETARDQATGGDAQNSASPDDPTADDTTADGAGGIEEEPVRQRSGSSRR